MATAQEARSHGVSTMPVGASQATKDSSSNLCSWKHLHSLNYAQPGVTAPSGGQWVGDSTRTAHKHQEAGECTEKAVRGKDPASQTLRLPPGPPGSSLWKAGLRGRLGDPPVLKGGMAGTRQRGSVSFWSLHELHLLVGKLRAEELLQLPVYCRDPGFKNTFKRTKRGPRTPAFTCSLPPPLGHPSVHFCI